MQMPQGLRQHVPNRAVVQENVRIQPKIADHSTVHINQVPVTTTTIHSLTPVQSKPVAMTEKCDDLPGTVKLDEGVESLDPSALASANKSFFLCRDYCTVCDIIVYSTYV